MKCGTSAALKSRRSFAGLVVIETEVVTAVTVMTGVVRTSSVVVLVDELYVLISVLNMSVGILGYSDEVLHCWCHINNGRCRFQAKIAATEGLRIGVVLHCLVDIVLNTNSVLSSLQMEKFFEKVKYAVLRARTRISFFNLVLLSGDPCCGELNGGQGRSEEKGGRTHLEYHERRVYWRLARKIMRCGVLAVVFLLWWPQRRLYTKRNRQDNLSPFTKTKVIQVVRLPCSGWEGGRKV